MPSVVRTIVVENSRPNIVVQSVGPPGPTGPQGIQGIPGDYDSGWRNVTSLATNLDGANIGTVLARRTAAYVTITVSNLLLAPGTGPITLWSGIPVGWRADRPASVMGVAARDNNSNILEYLNVTASTLSWVAEESIGNGAMGKTTIRPPYGITGQITYSVNSSFPVGLPGIPA